MHQEHHQPSLYACHILMRTKLSIVRTSRRPTFVGLFTVQEVIHGKDRCTIQYPENQVHDQIRMITDWYFSV